MIHTRQPLRPGRMNPTRSQHSTERRRPLPEDAPAPQDRRQAREQDKRPIRRGVPKPANRNPAPGLQERETYKSTADIPNAASAVEQAIKHASINSLVPLGGFALQLVDHATPGGAVPTSEESKRSGEQKQQRQAPLGGKAPEQEDGQRRAQRRHGRHSRGGEGEVSVVAQIPEQRRGQDPGDVEHG